MDEAGTSTFGRSIVTLGAADYRTRAAAGRALDSFGAPELDRGRVVCSFAVDSSTPEDGGPSTTVELHTEGDPDLLIMIVDTPFGAYARLGDPSDPGFTFFFLEVDSYGAVVQVVELPTRADVAACIAWLEGGRGAGPEQDLAEASPDDGLGVGHGSGFGGSDDRFAEAEPPAAPEAEAPPRFPSPAVPPVVPAPAPTPPPPGTQPTEMLAHALAEMPNRAAIGEQFDVTFTLSRLPQAPAPDAASDTARIRIDPERPITVSISMRGYRLIKGARRTRTLRLTTTEAKDVVTFAVEAVDAGPAEVTLVVRQHAELPLATLRLTTEIVDGAVDAQRTSAATDAAEPDPLVSTLPTLRIDESISGGESVLDIAAQVGASRAHGRSRTIDKASTIATVYEKIAALRDDLRDEPDRATRGQIGLTRLRAIGVDLARRVLGPDVRAFLWEHRADLDGLVIQTTGEFDVPWELIYVSDPTRSVDEELRVDVDGFLGMRGATRWVYNTVMPTQIRVRKGRAKYLCPSYRDPGLALDFTRDEGSLVRSLFGARSVRPGTAAAMSKVITDGFDLLHFGGHGVWTDAPPDQRLLLAGYRRATQGPDASVYSASDLRRDLPDRAMPDAAAPAPLVFLNACDVGRFGSTAVGLGGFPEAFLRGGVGVLLGCSWAVDDQSAGAFVRDFYRALETTDIAGAARHARAASLQNADLSALAYVIYSHPHATVSIA